MPIIDYSNNPTYNFYGGANMENCLTYIVPEAIEEYKNYHRTICFNLNRMIWNVSFLKKAAEMNKNCESYRNGFVIAQLYKNEFELLTLRLHRTLYDDGNDTITLPKLQSKLFKNYLFPQYRQELSQRLKSTSWNNPDIAAARRRTAAVVPIFRNTFIAHSLQKEVNELSYCFEDAEKVIMAACDLFSKLNFGAEEFYSPDEIVNLEHKKEQIACEEVIDEFFLYQYLSSYPIRKIDCSFATTESQNTLQSAINQINAKLDHEFMLLG